MPTSIPLRPPPSLQMLHNMLSTDTAYFFIKLSTALIPVAVFLVCRSLLFYRRTLPLPPGPRPWPLVGNLRDFPLHPTHAAELSAKYGMCTRHLLLSQATSRCAGHFHIEIGDVVHLSAFGKHIVLLGSNQAAVDLLDKRSSKYSDRNTYQFSKL